MKEEKRIKTKEEWMEELGIDDEGDIVGEEDLEVPLKELLAEENNNQISDNTKIPFSYENKMKEFVEFEDIEIPNVTNFDELKEYIDKLPRDKNFSISFSLKRRIDNDI